VNAQRRFRHGDPVGPLARTPEQWKAWALTIGQRPFRGTQIFQWLHARQQLDPDGMTDVPKAVRALLKTELEQHVPTLERVHEAADGTRKLVLRLTDHSAVESVLIPMDAEDKGEDDTELEDEQDQACAQKQRVTECVSTQAGCAMGCVFCASGHPGLLRHLTPDEIIAQVLIGRALLKPSQRLSNIVLMGMGEPLHNYDATVHAIQLMNCQEGLALSSRRITISTVGLVPQIDQLGKDFQGRIGLAISLHAADDAVRTRLLPINRRYPLQMLMQALRRYPLPPRRRLTIEIALIDGVNDSEQMARSLVALLRGIPVKINLIPLNPVPHTALRPPSEQRVEAFQEVLTRSGLSCFIRRRRGDDISAACGQLAGHPTSLIRQEPSPPRS
jgi:23S rRNA (adenine2503-C2)-methyltransferase